MRENVGFEEILLTTTTTNPGSRQHDSLPQTSSPIVHAIHARGPRGSPRSRPRYCTSNRLGPTTRSDPDTRKVAKDVLKAGNEDDGGWRGQWSRGQRICVRRRRRWWLVVMWTGLCSSLILPRYTISADPHNSCDNIYNMYTSRQMARPLRPGHLSRHREGHQDNHGGVPNLFYTPRRESYRRLGVF